MTQTSPAEILGVVDKATMRALIADVIDTKLSSLLDAVRAVSRPPAPAELLTTDDLAALLQIDERTLRRLVREGAVPPPIRIAGRILRWRRADLDRWLDAGGNPVKKPFHAARRSGSMSPVQTGGHT